MARSSPVIPRSFSDVTGQQVKLLAQRIRQALLNVSVIGVPVDLGNYGVKRLLKCFVRPRTAACVQVASLERAFTAVVVPLCVGENL
jgi:hypothetical protein